MKDIYKHYLMLFNEPFFMGIMYIFMFFGFKNSETDEYVLSLLINISFLLAVSIVSIRNGIKKDIQECLNNTIITIKD